MTTNQTAMDGTNVIDAKLHFVLVPLMAQGHTIPMVDMAHLLAGRGAHVSFVTTPLNALRIKPIVDHAKESHLPIEFVPLHFPCAEVGLPEGAENVDALPSRDHLPGFARACAMLRAPLTSYLRRHELSPSCVISDVFHLWTGDMARELDVPRISFNGSGCFNHLARHIVHQENVYEKVTDESEMRDLPGFPHRLRLTRAEAPGNSMGPKMEKLRRKMLEEESRADGVVVNTFDDIEGLYLECYQKAMGKKIWPIGPLCLCNRYAAHMAARGNMASVDENECLRWLDSMKTSSVVYVSFGSLVLTMLQQTIEIGMGLEATGCPFVWVIKAGEQSAEVEHWLSEGFEERTRSRGLLIREWAPQMVILSHRAVGGFVTHCGWNSTLEGISAGLPMVTWPHFGDQFVNQKLVVEILQIGVEVGSRPAKWGVKNSGMLVKREEVEKAVTKLMGGGEEGEGRRKRSRELGEKAKRAMEGGGSSHENMSMLIQQIRTKSYVKGERPS